MSSEAVLYRERVLATLDTMRTHEKDRLIIGLIDALYPNGDPDHAVSGADFIAEAIRLTAAFHPSNLAPKEVPATPKDTEPDIAF
jgi:hypothetical protein